MSSGLVFKVRGGFAGVAAQAEVDFLGGQEAGAAERRASGGMRCPSGAARAARYV